jgi:DNA-binding transcriptional regulator YdaS (Cro superfamily)
MNLVIARAVEIAGGQTALAKACGVTQQLVWHWLHVAERVPAERIIDIEKATNGAVSRRELRPDLYSESAAA